MAIWNRKRNEPRDRHREFIYLDEVSVVSLLAGLQGEIKEAVTDTLSRTEDHSLGGTIGAAKAGASVESRLGASRTSTNEVVRRAVIQSTFRDLWRRDVGVLLHNISGIKRRSRKPIHSYRDLENALRRLKKAKLAVPLSDIHRGDIVEMDVKIEADQFFKIITMGTTILDLMNGREDLFGISDADVREVAPMIEVLRELLVGLVPMRGLATSHSVIEVAGERVVIATELLGNEVRGGARPLELVGFAESDSFWRDLRRTLFSGSTFTVYARAEGPVLSSPWSPIKIADLLESLSPDLRDQVVLPLQQLDLGNTQSVETPEARATAQFQLDNFAVALQTASGTTPDSTAVNEAVATAIPALASATTIEERRRAFEPVAQAVAGEDADRDLLLRIRSDWIDRLPAPAQNHSPVPRQQPDSGMSPIQLEVGFVALYW
ncbi:DUF6414 family protein [Gulosibacter molinativorax]|uniref:Uncharacterized protein n=1 Tax=Gulosibacter molinativorax TaxID=256821 RepID=A0ABT7CBU1_9MICO|nr:hypothetical protein [Gulosibacter molinativorax]MDJ1372632.1 hypothetical protein [Gulosibacter molinativorax]QUY62831.1 Hypotetical protein [Gulosibacter molinativorax]